VAEADEAVARVKQMRVRTWNLEEIEIFAERIWK
jgi:hypothetical protein